MCIGLGDDVALHLHVHHDEVGSIERVGHDAAYKGRSQDHRVGSLLVEELLDRILVSEVKLLMGSTDKVGVTSPLQVLPYGGTYKAAMTCNINL